MVVDGVASPGAAGSGSPRAPGADAQDLFLAGRIARVTAVLSTSTASAHVALVLDDDPGADLHEWYGRYLYFAPEELGLSRMGWTAG